MSSQTCAAALAPLLHEEGLGTFLQNKQRPRVPGRARCKEAKHVAPRTAKTICVATFQNFCFH